MKKKNLQTVRSRPLTNGSLHFCLCFASMWQALLCLVPVRLHKIERAHGRRLSDSTALLITQLQCIKSAIWVSQTIFGVIYAPNSIEFAQSDGSPFIQNAFAFISYLIRFSSASSIHLWFIRQTTENTGFFVILNEWLRLASEHTSSHSWPTGRYSLSLHSHVRSLRFVHRRQAHNMCDVYCPQFECPKLAHNV